MNRARSSAPISAPKWGRRSSGTGGGNIKSRPAVSDDLPSDMGLSKTVTHSSRPGKALGGLGGVAGASTGLLDSGAGHASIWLA